MEVKDKSDATAGGRRWGSSSRNLYWILLLLDDCRQKFCLSLCKTLHVIALLNCEIGQCHITWAFPLFSSAGGSILSVTCKAQPENPIQHGHFRQTINTQNNSKILYFLLLSIFLPETGLPFDRSTVNIHRILVWHYFTSTDALYTNSLLQAWLYSDSKKEDIMQK